jgi:hypothetical protein
MNGYEYLTPRVALGQSAAAMAAITVGALVVLPAKIDAVSGDAYTAAASTSTNAHVAETP